VKPWSNGISALIISDIQELAHFLFATKMSREDTAKRQARKRALTRNHISWHLDLGLSSLQNCDKANS
jgi:hypothetical protein